MSSTDARIQALRRAGAWVEASRLLAAEHHYDDAADCLLKLLPDEETLLRELDSDQRRAAAQAAMLYARAGRAQLAAAILINLNERRRAAEALQRAGLRQDAILVMRGEPLPSSPWSPGRLSSNLFAGGWQVRTDDLVHDPLALADRLADTSRTADAMAVLLKVAPSDPRYRPAVARAVRIARVHDLMSLKVDQFVGPFLEAGRGHERTPADAQALYDLGLLYEAIDMEEMAEVAYAAVMEVRPAGYLDAAERLARLADDVTGTEAELGRILDQDQSFRDVDVERRSHPGAALALEDTVDVVPELPDDALAVRVDTKSLELGLGPLGIGSIVSGRFRVEEALGEGGFAVVYRVTDLAMNEPAALKLFVRSVDDPSALDRFKQEMRITRELIHPNIVLVHEFGSWRDAHFITMELLEGRDLEAELSATEAPLDPARVLRLSAQAFAGIGEAHRQGIVHRDIKPGNLFLCDDGDVLKVMDFGIAKRGDAIDGPTLVGHVVGTPAYLAPERLRDETYLGPSVDLYAMGVCMYRALTGVLPFTARHIEGLFMKILQDEPAAPSLINGKVRPATDAIVMKLLAKEPRHRYADADAVIGAIIEASTGG